MDVLDDVRQVVLEPVTAVALVVVMGALLTYDVVVGIRSHAAFLSALRTAPPNGAEAVRARFLRRWAWQPWCFTGAALLLVAVAPGPGLADIGLRLPRLPDLGESAGSVLIGAAVGIALVAVGIGVAARRGKRAGTPAAAPPVANAKVQPMLPTGRADRRAWLLVSATAGITEEIMYRGVLLLVLASLLPALGWVPVCAIAVVAFGAAHAYQGPVGMLTTGVAAVPFLGLYLATGSLLPGMVLHFAVDARAALGGPVGPSTAPPER